MWLNEDLLHFHHHHWKWYDDSEKAFGDLMNMAESTTKTLRVDLLGW
jgi:hypothetical protein